MTIDDAADGLYDEGLTEEQKIVAIYYFRVVDKLSLDDAIKKVDAMSKFLRENMNGKP